MKQIDVKLLHPHPKSANKMDDERFEKLKQNIAIKNRMPALIVKKHPELEGEYVIIDGYYRHQVAIALKMETVPCEVWDMAADEEDLLLLTLNRLRGEDIPQKRAELIQSLLEHVAKEKLSLLIPESTAEIEMMMNLLNRHDEQLKKAFEKQLKKEAQSLPVMLHYVVNTEEANLIKTVLSTIHPDDPNIALVQLCQRYQAETDQSNTKPHDVGRPIEEVTNPKENNDQPDDAKERLDEAVGHAKNV